jgi:hypothetical protein
VVPRRGTVRRASALSRRSPGCAFFP